MQVSIRTGILRFNVIMDNGYHRGHVIGGKQRQGQGFSESGPSTGITMPQPRNWDYLSVINIELQSWVYTRSLKLFLVSYWSHRVFL